MFYLCFFTARNSDLRGKGLEFARRDFLALVRVLEIECCKFCCVQFRWDLSLLLLVRFVGCGSANLNLQNVGKKQHSAICRGGISSLGLQSALWAS